MTRTTTELRKHKPSGEEAEAERAIGARIGGKYLLTRLLGAGGMGAVYEAVHEFTKRRVAVKLMHAGLARSQVFAERFLREAQAPGSIGHPGIVEVLDGGRGDDGSLYLVLELLEGGTLADAMRERRLTEAELGQIILELLDALDAAHAAGFVHRDIKPDNVFLLPTEDGTPIVKLLDFGVAGMLAGLEDNPALTQAGTVLGTPLYMSPEQALGKSVDGRSDLWSVGAVMYQALTGDPPFAGDSVQALIVSIATQQHAPLGTLRPELSRSACAVIEQALRKNVTQRWQSAGEMAAALRAALTPATRPHAAQAVAPVPMIAAPSGNSRTLALSLAALLALSAIASFAFVRTRSRDGSKIADTASLAPVGPAPAMRAAAATPAANAGAEPVPAVTQPTTAQAEAPTTVAPEPPSPTKVPLAAPAPAAAAPFSQEGVTRVLREHQSELRRCYEEAMVPVLMQAESQAPSVKPSKFEVALQIASDGSVQSVELQGDAPDAIRPCAERALRAWRFPKGETTTEISFPVVFQPSVVR